jgi:cold shock CspA family protein
VIVKLERKRKKGRPGMSWMDGVKKDLRSLGIVNWRAKTQRAGWLENDDDGDDIFSMILKMECKKINTTPKNTEIFFHR